MNNTELDLAQGFGKVDPGADKKRLEMGGNSGKKKKRGKGESVLAEV